MVVVVMVNVVAVIVAVVVAVVVLVVVIVVVVVFGSVVERAREWKGKNLPFRIIPPT